MVEHRGIFSLYRALLRLCSGIAVLMLFGITASAAQDHAALAGVRLKLDWDMMPRLNSPGIDRTSLLSAEAPTLRGRLLKTRDQVAVLEQSNADKTVHVSHHEELIQRMRGVVAAQEKVIARLAAEAQRPKVKAVAQTPVSITRPPPAPLPQAGLTVAPPIHIGPLELPGIVRNYVVEGALVGIIVLLLGWALYLRSSAASKAAELVVLKGHGLTSAKPKSEAEAEAPVPPEPPPKVKSKRKKAPKSKPAPEKKAAAPVVAEALREIDTLIAYEDFAKAKELLDKAMQGNEGNPEYRLRLLHVESSMGDKTKAAEEEEILAAMMEGTLSETMYRVKEIGRGLMPGHPLFDDAEQVEQAKRIIDAHESKKQESTNPEISEAAAPRKPVPEAEQKPQAPPLILDMEADDETIDFLTEIYPEGAEDGEKKAEKN